MRKESCWSTDQEVGDIDQESYGSSLSAKRFLWLYAVIGSVLFVLGLILAVLTLRRMADGVLFVDTALLSVSVIVIGIIAIYLGREFGRASKHPGEMKIKIHGEEEIG